MILPNAKRVIYLNAGHHSGDPGASIQKPPNLLIQENQEIVKVRDVCVPLLKAAGFRVEAVPDDLNLRQSIGWVNERAKGFQDGLAVDIHLNYLTDPKARGTEAFYGTSGTTRSIAEILSREVSKSMGIPDRGAKPDTASFVGSLGWIRKTNCWAVLVEICFLSSPEDLAVLHGPDGYKKAAEGVVNGLREIFGEFKPPEITKEVHIRALEGIIAGLKRLLEFLKNF